MASEQVKEEPTSLVHIGERELKQASKDHITEADISNVLLPILGGKRILEP
jgi:hypothetical protein